MAKDDKKTEKTEHEKKDDTKKGFLGALLDQAITEWTRPLVEKIPLPILQIMKKAGMDKILPVLSIAIGTALSKSGFAFGDGLGDFVAEFTAEIRRVMNEKVSEEGITEPTKGERGKAGILNQILLGLDASEITEIFSAFAELFKNDEGQARPEKEVKQILALLEQMDGKELYVFLKLEKAHRDTYLKIFIKKAEIKPLAESIKDFKTEIQKTRAELKIIKDEILVPVWAMVKPGVVKAGDKLKEIDAKFAPDTEIGRMAIGLRSWTERLKNEELARH